MSEMPTTPDPSTPSVIIGFVHGSHDVALFHTSLRRLLQHDARQPNPRIADVISIEASPRIASFRNQLVEMYLSLNYPHLLMLDTDMLMPPDLADRLLAHLDPETRPIIAGLYFGGRLHGKQRAQIYRLTPAGNGLDSIEGLGAPGQWGRLVEVHAAGAGCLLMHREALVKVGEAFANTGFPWFVEGRGSIGGQQGRDIGEDVAFCLRAQHLGIPIYADTSTILGHAKVGIIDERTHAAYLLDRDALGEEGVEHDLIERLRMTSPEVHQT
jgi:hypothetical protein